jgi:hypothetical protein
MLAPVGTPPGNATDWEKFEWFIEEMEANKGEDLLLFILNVINIIGELTKIGYALETSGSAFNSQLCVSVTLKHLLSLGMVLLICYTGYGLSALPCGYIWSRR